MTLVMRGYSSSLMRRLSVWRVRERVRKGVGDGDDAGGEVQETRVCIYLSITIAEVRIVDRDEERRWK